MDEIFYIVRADLKGATVKRQREVAQACGIAWSTLRRIVDGASNVNYETVLKLRGHYLGTRETVAPEQQHAAALQTLKQQMG